MQCILLAGIIMNRMRMCIFLATILAFVPISWVKAQPPGNNQGIVSVNGTAELTKSPKVIRLYFKQYGKGTDQDSAKTALVAAEKKLLAKLESAGAEVIVAHAGVALPSQNLLNRHRNIANILMQRQMNLNGGMPQSQHDKNSYLERFLTVDLRPKAKTKEPVSLLADLLERLRKDYQDLSGMTDALPKDSNNNENNPVDYQMFRNDTSMLSNDIRFQLAAKITREDRLKLYAEAMRRARSMAQDLADAAEMKVGSIQTLSSSFNTGYNVNGSSMRGMNSSGEVAKFPFTLKEDGSEGIAVRDLNMNGYGSGAPEPLTYSISLSASFKLEPAK